jgi:hypothetical protein
MYEKGLIEGESFAKIHQEKVKTAPQKIDDPLILVSARIKKSLREDIRKNGVSISYVIKRGMGALYSEPAFVNRIRDSETDIQSLQSKLKSMAIKNNMLFEEIERLKQTKLTEAPK